MSDETDQLTWEAYLSRIEQAKYEAYCTDEQDEYEERDDYENNPAIPVMPSRTYSVAYADDGLPF